MIIHCTCKHAQQDRAHGAGKRVHNLCHPDKKPQLYRCTVCGKEREGA